MRKNGAGIFRVAAAALLLFSCSKGDELTPYTPPEPAPVQLTMLTEGISLTSGGESFVDFRISPYESVFDYDVQGGHCAISLSNLLGAAPEDLNCALSRIEPAGETFADTGKYRVYLKDIRKQHTYDVILCLKYTDGQGRKATSPGFKVHCECDAQTRSLLDAGLPLVIIETVGGETPTCEYVSHPPGCMGGGTRNATKVPGRVSILDGNDILYDSGDYVEGESGMTIRIRGNTSAYGTKKPFKIKLQKKADLLFRDDPDEKKFRDKDWLLLRYDGLKMLAGCRVNELVGMQWTPQFSFVNVCFNGQYHGLYMLSEAVERNPDCRLNVSQSGYVIEYDAYWWNEDVHLENKWTYGMAYTFKYPDDEAITPEQLTYIQRFIDKVETSVSNGDYSRYIDVVSFAKWLLGHDILGSVDGAGSNYFLTKYDETEGSKLKMANMWDFDGVFQRPDTWSTAHGWNGNYFPTLMNSANPEFRQAYVSLWDGYSKTLCKNASAFMKSFAGSETGKAVDASIVLDNKRWHSGLKSVEESTATAREWFDSRAGWLNSAIASLR